MKFYWFNYKTLIWSFIDLTTKHSYSAFQGSRQGATDDDVIVLVIAKDGDPVGVAGPAAQGFGVVRAKEPAALGAGVEGGSRALEVVQAPEKETKY